VKAIANTANKPNIANIICNTSQQYALVFPVAAAIPKHLTHKGRQVFSIKMFAGSSTDNE
jgi:hypothetical protein